MRSLTSFSMSASCAAVSAALLKSKVSLSGVTLEPFCVASWLTTSCNAQCRMCVTVWCRSMA
jgi:hypothetical protein